MSYENTPMKIQWREIDGQQVPFVLPQVWSHEKQDWVVTSEQDRLPVDARLTGSIVEELRKWENLNPFEGGYTWYYFSNNEISGPSSVRPINVSGFIDKSIHIENNLNITLAGIRVYGMSISREEDDPPINRDNHILFYFDVDETLDQGEIIYITSDDYPDLRKPCIGLLLRVKNDSGGESEGDLSVTFYGSRI